MFSPMPQSYNPPQATPLLSPHLPVAQSNTVNMSPFLQKKTQNSLLAILQTGINGSFLTVGVSEYYLP